MLKERIILTLKYFDLQNWPLTLLELHEFLLNDVNLIKAKLNSEWELNGGAINGEESKPVAIDQVLDCLRQDCEEEVEEWQGFYFLKGRKDIATERQENYLLALKRENLIKKYIWFVKYIPFVRGVALAGSQAMGERKGSSDIDLLIITDPDFLWLPRTLITAYFQFFGIRRHGNKIANRFCLNHYVAGAKTLSLHRNLYTASEYLKLRPLIYGQAINSFQVHNQDWVQLFFPNAKFEPVAVQPQNPIQKMLEKLFTNGFGKWLENKLKSWEAPRIRSEKYIVVAEDELSFHPNSKQGQLLADFFA